jgi:GNAT superfamily N-acetyltransferase
MHIRSAALDDAAVIGELMTELGYPTTAEAMRERLTSLASDPSYVTLVAETDDGVVGVIGGTTGHYYEKDGSYARLLVLSVSSAARGIGIGAQLVVALERWAQSRGARDIVVNSAFHRARAHAFYERLGYVGTGVRMVKTLNGS